MNAPTREEFLARRMTGIGGSDIAAIMGFNKYRTPLDVYFSKVDPQDDDDMSEAAYWGIRLEAEVAREFQERTGMKVQRVNKMLSKESDPWMLANIDRAIIDPSIAGVVRWKDGRLTTTHGLECKTANQFTDGDWGEEMTDQVPDAYVCQCQWYMAVTGCTEWFLAVLIGGQKFKIYLIKRDDEFIEMLTDRARHFWFENVLARVEPDPVTFADAMRLYGAPEPGSPYYMSFDDMSLLAKYRELKSAEKAIKAQAEDTRLSIIKRVANNDSLIYNGELVATFKPQKTSSGETRVLRIREAA